MKNYAGHRLSPWLGHLMVSRQETARPLLTPGEVMQLPPDDELVWSSGCHPIRARKARYYEDPSCKARILPPPDPSDVAERHDTSARPAASALTSVEARRGLLAGRRRRPRIRPMRASAGSLSFPSMKRSRSSRPPKPVRGVRAAQMTSLGRCRQRASGAAAPDAQARPPGRARSRRRHGPLTSECAPSTPSACRRTSSSSSPTIAERKQRSARRSSSRPRSLRSCRPTAPTGWKPPWRAGSIA